MKPKRRNNVGNELARASARKPRGNNAVKEKWYHSRSSAVAWQDHQPSPRTLERRGHRLGKKERACTQAMPSLKNVESASPKTHVSFTLQKLNGYQNVQQNQTNVEAMTNV